MLLLSYGAEAGADPAAHAHLRTAAVATRAIGSVPGETDLDLDSRFDVSFEGLLRPELSGRLVLRDRRDLQEPPQGSALRDAWDARPGRDQERFEQVWLEFGDRLALRVGRQMEWITSPVRFDGASVRLRRIGPLVDSELFGGNRARLDTAYGSPWELDPVAGGSVTLELGGLSLLVRSLYRSTHLFDVEARRRLGRQRAIFDDLELRLGYSQLDLAPRDLRGALEAAFHGVPLRLILRADARLFRDPDEFLFDYTTSMSEPTTRELRLHIEPLAPGVDTEVRIEVRPVDVLRTSLNAHRRQLFSPGETTAFTFSSSGATARVELLAPGGALWGSGSVTFLVPDLPDPPRGAGVASTSGEGERREILLSLAGGIRLRIADASLGVQQRRFDYLTSRAILEGVDALSALLRLTLVLHPLLRISVWGAYDEALPFLDQELHAVLQSGIVLDLRSP